MMVSGIKPVSFDTFSIMVSNRYHFGISDTNGIKVSSTPYIIGVEMIPLEPARTKESVSFVIPRAIRSSNRRFNTNPENGTSGQDCIGRLCLPLPRQGISSELVAEQGPRKLAS